MITILLIALISHILCDFVLQTDKIKNGRFPECEFFKECRNIIIKSNLKHALIHALMTFISITIVNLIAQIKLNINLIQVFLIFTSHFLIDMFKSYITFHKKEHLNNVWIFLIDQLAHFIAIILIFNITSINNFLNVTYDIIINFPATISNHDKVLIVILVLLICTYGTGYFAKVLLNSIGNSENQLKIEAKNGGFTIGILERLFIILGIVIKQPNIIAFVLTLKSIARYKKFSEDTFVEYFIIGTFLSLVVAIIGGVIISKIMSFNLL